YSKISLAFSSIGNYTDVDTLNATRDLLTPVYRQEFREDNLQFSGLINRKFSVNHVVRLGAFVTYKNYNLLDSTFVSAPEGFRTLRDQQSVDMLYQPYINWHYRINEKWEMNTGLHSMILASSGNYSIEPRLGISYRMNAVQS